MPIEAFLNGTALVFLAVALVLSCLLYWKDLKTKIISATNLCSLLVLISSIVYMLWIYNQSGGEIVQSVFAVITSAFANLYAGLCNVAARVWVRVREMMGNKLLSIKVQLEER